jgi:hypothetical protein
VLGSKLHHHTQSRRDDRTHPPRASAEAPTNSTPNAPPNSNASSARPSPKSTPALRNPSTFVIPSAARNPYHLQTRYPRCSALTWGRMNSPHYRGRARLQPCQKTATEGRCLAAAGRCCHAHNSQLTTHDFSMDALPVWRTDGMGPIRDRRCVTTQQPEGRNMLAQHGSAGYRTGAKPLPRCRRRSCFAHNSQLTTHDICLPRPWPRGKLPLSRGLPLCWS